MINFTKPTSAPQVNHTEDQKAALSSQSNVILINSTAGSGKTLLAQQFAFDNPKSKVLYLAFNKQIVEDVRNKLPENCTAATFHSFGLSMIKKSLGKVRVDFNKYNKLTTGKIAELVSKHYSIGGGESRSSWNNTCDRFMLSRRLITEAQEVTSQANEMVNTVSGNDMISLPLRLGLVSDSYDIIICDEIQDCGMDKIQLISTVSADRLIMVGDTEYQQINSFSGSDPDITNLLKKVFNPEIHTINETFRCPAEIIYEAQKINPNFNGSKQGGNVSENWLGNVEFAEDSLILCRANAPLLKIASELIKKRKSFSIKKTVTTQISSIIKRLSKQTSNINILRELCVEEGLEQEKTFKKNGWNTMIPVYKYEAVLAALNVGSSLGDTESFIKTLNDNTLSKSNRILSTIHSSKGTQSENVYYVEPSIGNKIASKSKSKVVKKEEENVNFVAITRSQKNLTYVSI